MFLCKVRIEVNTRLQKLHTQGMNSLSGIVKKAPQKYLMLRDKLYCWWIP